MLRDKHLDEYKKAWHIINRDVQAILNEGNQIPNSTTTNLKNIGIRVEFHKLKENNEGTDPTTE